MTAAISWSALFAAGIHTQSNCLLPGSADELLHDELQQLLGSAEEAVGVQELVDVAFHCDISAIKSVKLNSEKIKIHTMNATSPQPSINIGNKLKVQSYVTASCEIVEESWKLDNRKTKSDLCKFYRKGELKREVGELGVGGVIPEQRYHFRFGCCVVCSLLRLSLL